jgi:hypothetical protein
VCAQAVATVKTALSASPPASQVIACQTALASVGPLVGVITSVLYTRCGAGAYGCSPPITPWQHRSLPAGPTKPLLCLRALPAISYRIISIDWLPTAWPVCLPVCLSACLPGCLAAWLPVLLVYHRGAMLACVRACVQGRSV